MITKYLSNGDLRLISDLLQENVEVCGHIYKGENSKFFLYSESSGSVQNNRGTCQHKKYSNIIWHTHPKNLKGYPSMEDIRKILRTKSIKTSIIFTDWGVWELSAKKKDSVSRILENTITKLGDKLYLKSEKGRKFPGNTIISGYITKLTNECSKYELNVLFYQM